MGTLTHRPSTPFQGQTFGATTSGLSAYARASALRVVKNLSCLPVTLTLRFRVFRGQYPSCPAVRFFVLFRAFLWQITLPLSCCLSTFVFFRVI